MKTGAVAKKFRVDPNTIADWTERFSEFFTPDALSDIRKQRDYQPEDIVVLNTIRVYRARNTDWEEIRADLRGGERETNLPAEFMAIDGGNAITIYAEMREMRVKLDAAEAEIERLRQELDDEREKNQTRIEQIIRDAAKWETRYEMLFEQMKKAEDDDK